MTTSPALLVALAIQAAPLVTVLMMTAKPVAIPYADVPPNAWRAQTKEVK